MLVWIGSGGTFEGEIAFSDVGLGGDLMRIYAIAESELFVSGGVFLSEEVRYSEIIVSGLQERLVLVSYIVSGCTLRANKFLVC